MEKDDKIQHTKKRNMQIIMGSVFTTACIILLWGLLHMDDNVAIKTATSPFLRTDLASGSVDNAHNQQPHDQQAQRTKVEPAPNSRQVEKKGAAKEEGRLETLVQSIDREVRNIKSKLPTGHFMETDETAQSAIKKLQEATRLLLKSRYGPTEPYRVRVDLIFQESNPTLATHGPTDSFEIELAPAALQPHSVFSFLEIARHWSKQKGAFHRRAGHVLQVMVGGQAVPHLAFQEYSSDYPHRKGTVGYAGRPSGPGWYVSIQDNTRNHGPGSQQQANPHEADSCFGTIVEGFEDVVLARVTKMPGQGFLKRPAHVLIDAMTILVPDHDGKFKEWKPSPGLTEIK